MSSPTPVLDRTDRVILLIEDDDSVRRITARILGRDGFVVSSWARAEDALTMLASSDQEFCLLLTDTVMPDIDGPEAARRVVALRPGIPVVFMSGYGEDVISAALVTAPEHSFIAKPFRSEELTDGVRRALASQRVEVR
jgi:two-component system cell cycle sensor histidine kinase/response regulator CckA